MHRVIHANIINHGIDLKNDHEIDSILILKLIGKSKCEVLILLHLALHNCSNQSYDMVLIVIVCAFVCTNLCVPYYAQAIIMA